MGIIPRLIILKKILRKPGFQYPKSGPNHPRKPNLRSLSSNVGTKGVGTLSSEILKNVGASPNESVVHLLEQHFGEDNGEVLMEEINKLVRKLRKLKRFDRALEIYEWSKQKSLNSTDSGDLAVHLDLIGKMHGLDAAEKFFYEMNEHSEKVYGSMLNSYVQAKLVDKSLSLFKTMKEMGIASSALTYNSIMSLYLKTGQAEKIDSLLSEMQENGISPDDVSYRMCLKACALTSNFDSLDEILKTIENQPRNSLDWFAYSSVANYYIEGGHMDKARNCLQKAEGRVNGNAVGYNNLISAYTKLGDVSEVTRLWQKHKDVCQAQSNADYMVMLSALVKFDKFQEAEKLLEEWESSDNVHDSRVPDVLLLGYAQKERVEEAERILEGMINRYPTTVPSSWVIISEGYVKRLNMLKAVQCMEKALQLGPQHKEWVPKRAVISNILNWLGDHGQMEQVYEFLKMMSRVVPMNKNMYQALLKSSKRHGKDIDDILQRVKADNIDVDEETNKMMTEEGDVKVV
ncbi:hypothetical protein vseg_011080 [Gypsophila vaccaria]